MTVSTACTKASKKKGTLFGALGLLTVLIASLGLYGLAALNAQQKVKEIGIRKILGASLAGILLLTSRKFLIMILGGFLVAVPLASFTMQAWLENYAYRVTIDWFTFAVVGLLALLIAMLTISGHALKSALANPVDCLRDD